uniref:Gem-associated protein 5 n=1 Tax=Aceria tosichella TaxID=561515 RepID=A0A6G1SAY6_9ACAR
MTKSKCSFLIGPVSSWFMPNAIDIWTQPQQNQESLSYFAYGSIGCYCIGEIHKHSNRIGAVVNELADVKNDNSRVACVRFQKDSSCPVVLVLTESGTLLIHDCLLRENLLILKKSELLKKFTSQVEDDNNRDSRSVKKAKFNVTQQLNSCTWPDPSNIFIGATLLNEKTCMLIRVKLNNIIEYRNRIQHDCQQNNKDLVIDYQKIDLDLKNFTSPICLIESRMLDEKTCLIAVAMDDGLITMIRLNLEDNRVLRNIKLARHNNQICSMSLFVGDTRKFPLGLLASVSRDGLVFIWDIENEFYFADYLAIQNADKGSSAKINWFALRFISIKDLKSVYLAVSNVNSGITLLKLPENARSKIRLKEVNREVKPKWKNNQNDQVTLKHNALIFNIEYDPITQVLISSSLDGNQILWSANQSDSSPSAEEVKPQFLIPAMLDNARTHMLRHNPINESLLGLALGKAGVRFYSISDNLLNSKFDMSPSCSLVARKLAKTTSSPTSIAWHPHHEYRLAIGTLEGKVFKADITPRKAALVEAEPARQFSETQSSNFNSNGSSGHCPLDEALGVEYNPIKRDTSETDQSKNARSGGNQNRPKTDGIYSICWGPNPACPEDIAKHAIYAIGSLSHRLFVYCSPRDNSDKLTNYLDEFKDTSLPEATCLASEVAWKSSMDMMALGTIDGRIIIVAYLDESHQERSNHKLFKHLVTIKGPFGASFIQCLAWHPSADKEDSSYYKIAASSNESPAFVFNLKETILVADVRARLRLEQSNGDSMASNPQLNLLASYANKLKAHEKAITDIAWNPHEPNQLATCSFDRTCYVWSIDGSLLDARVVAKFSARDRLFTLDWSLVDSDLIFTSGHDSVVWAWRPTENPHHLVSV